MRRVAQVDAECPGVVDVRRTHAKRQNLVRESMKKDASLREKFLDAESADLLAHLASCERCRTFDATHRCPVCGLALRAEVGGPLCTSGWHKFKRIVGWLPKAEGRDPRPKPASSKPAKAPAPAAPTARAKPARAAPVAQAAAPAARSKSSRPSTAAPAAKPAPKPAPKPAAAKPASARPAPRPPSPPPAPRVQVEEKAREPHEVLGVAPDAALDEVTRAYREKAKNYHPDRVTHLAPEFKALAEKHMLELNGAYDVMRKRAQALEKSGAA